MKSLNVTIDDARETEPLLSAEQVKKLMAIRQKISEIEKAVDHYQTIISKEKSHLLVEVD